MLLLHYTTTTAATASDKELRQSIVTATGCILNTLKVLQIQFWLSWLARTACVEDVNQLLKLMRV